MIFPSALDICQSITYPGNGRERRTDDIRFRI